MLVKHQLTTCFILFLHLQKPSWILLLVVQIPPPHPHGTNKGISYLALSAPSYEVPLQPHYWTALFNYFGFFFLIIFSVLNVLLFSPRFIFLHSGFVALLEPIPVVSGQRQGLTLHESSLYQGHSERQRTFYTGSRFRVALTQTPCTCMKREGGGHV